VCLCLCLYLCVSVCVCARVCVFIYCLFVTLKDTNIISAREHICSLRLKNLVIAGACTCTCMHYCASYHIHRHMNMYACIHTYITRICTQDAKRLSQVFREPKHRLLVLIGPVVPRKSCSPAILNQVLTPRAPPPLPSDSYTHAYTHTRVCAERERSGGLERVSFTLAT